MKRAEIHDDQVAVEAQIHKDPGQGQGPALVKPLQEAEGAPLAVGKISQHQDEIPDAHDPVGQDHTEHQAGHGPAPEYRQQKPQEKTGQHRGGKSHGDGPVVLESGQIVHLGPDHDHGEREPHADDPVDKRDARKQKDGAVQHQAEGQHDRQRSVKGGHDPLPLLLIEHIGDIPREDHIEKTGDKEGDQEAVGQHAVHDLALVLGYAGDLGDKRDPQEEADAHDHGPDRHRARIGVRAAEIQHSFFLK